MSSRDRDRAESVNGRIDETLAALEGTDPSDVEPELARRLADRARELAAPADPPLHVEELAERQGREAETEFDPETELEVARYWFEGDVEFEPSLTVSDGRSSLALEIPAGVEQIDPPSMAEERADPEEIRERNLDIEALSPGSIEPHLPLSFQPEFVEVPDRDLGPEEDRPVSVFPPDTRYVFRDTSFPWSTTGRVETASGACTGTMVGKNLLLTASHCVNWQDSGAGWLKFTPAYYGGNKPFGQAWGERILYWNRAEGGLTNTETAFDYAVVKLDREIGNHTGYTGYRTYASSWNDSEYWQHVGYPGDLTGTQRPVFYGDGEIDTTQSRSTSGQSGLVMGHFMDITGGHSGGPVWGWWDDEPWPRVVGVQSAEARTPSMDTSGDNEAGGGPALSQLIGYARSQYH